MKIKHIFLSVTAIAVIFASASAQTGAGDSEFKEHVRRQRAEFERFKQQTQTDFNNYRDSVNREYAAFLEQKWKVFDMRKEDPPIKTPVPVPPVYDPASPRPAPENVPVITPPLPLLPPPNPQPKPEPAKPDSPDSPDSPVSPSKPVRDRKPQPEPLQYPVKIEFFGTPVALKRLSSPSLKPLPGVSEKDVASYWSLLSKQPHEEWSNEIWRVKTELGLNDWGMYLLINKLFKVYFPSGTANEQVIFTVFMLNQSGYRARVGRNQNELVPLIAFQQKVYYMYFFRYGEGDNTVRYSALNPQHKDLSAIRSCEIDFPGATRNLDMRIETSPHLTNSLRSSTTEFGRNTCTINYNRNLVDFYSTYPCVDFPVYAGAPLDPVTLQSIESQVGQDIRDRSQEEGVNLLLHFVQQAFRYKTDTEQFGHERWLFAEETVASPFSDCEDRSILFAQLARRILGMQTVLIHYPGIHVATAVKFDNRQTDGDHIIVNGTKYLICDPTYTGANLGTAMPDLKNVKVEVFPIN